MSEASASNGSDTYALATGTMAAERLVLQDKIASEKSHEHILKAGLKKNSVVYDIGCGNGMMTAFIAKTVGKNGHVYAVDASPEQLVLAKERIKVEGLNNVTFILSDINLENELTEGIADIVYARFLLMHLKHPESAVAKMKKLLKPNGVVASQESILSTCYSTYQPNIFNSYTKAMIALGENYGVDYNIGNRLKSLYEGAGFDKVDVFYHQQNISASDARKLFILGLNEKRDKSIKSKVATKENFDFWEKYAKSIPVDDPSFSYAMAKQAYILAWKY